MTKNLNKIKKHQEKGITLIVLIVTIVVLLILAGVTINAITGSENVIEKAQEEKTKTDIVAAKEQAELTTLGYIQGYSNGKHSGSGGTYENELEYITDQYTANPTHGNYKISVANGKITVSDLSDNEIVSGSIDEDGMITWNDVNTIKAAGLYQEGVLKKSWQDLIDEEIITVENNTITGSNKSSLVGELVLDNSITSIGNSAFNICSGLTSVTIPSSVTSIGRDAFRMCSGLTSIPIPSSVTSIGGEAFLSCTGLTSVTIPSSVTSIDMTAFGGCGGLKSIVVESGNCIYDSRNNCNAIIKTSTNELIAGCENTIIPSSVTCIGNYAFDRRNSLTSITIPSNVTEIANWAFAECSGLTSITIPSSVTRIGSDAFFKCSGLTSITIPSSVKRIEDYAFVNCRGLTSVTIPSSVTSIGRDAFKSLKAGSTIYVENEDVKTLLSGKYDTDKTTVTVDTSKF